MFDSNDYKINEQRKPAKEHRFITPNVCGRTIWVKKLNQAAQFEPQLDFQPEVQLDSQNEPEFGFSLDSQIEQKIVQPEQESKAIDETNQPEEESKAIDETNQPKEESKAVDETNQPKEEFKAVDLTYYYDAFSTSQDAMRATENTMAVQTPTNIDLEATGREGADQGPPEAQIDSQAVELISRDMRSESILITKSPLVETTDLNDFILESQIGSGSFGRVFLAVLARTGEKFAMKAIRKDKLLRSQTIENTRLEMNVLSQINHPFICSLRYVFQS